MLPAQHDRRAVVALFAGASALGAALLFSVQPMAGKMVLPLLGGAPAVWSTCMVFFQLAVLAGYAWAHVLTAYGARLQLAIHGGLGLIGMAVLPITVSEQGPPPGADPAWWLLRALCLAAGAPLVFVCATAPLVQAAYARTRRASGGDPYFLYAASNAGSLIALLAYPSVLERWLTVPEQARAWSSAFLVLVMLVLACLFGSRRFASPVTTSSLAAVEPIPLARCVHWLALACVPSSLLLGVTGHLTANVAAVPLLWVVPLALYLVTFIVAFGSGNPTPARLVTRAYPALVLLLGPLIFFDLRDLTWIAIVPHLMLFFGAASMCHAGLARTRPDPRRLTQFYLWIAAGGALGGLFNASVAPALFDSVAEYPLMVVASVLLLPDASAMDAARRPWTDFLLPVALAFGSMAAVLGFDLGFSNEQRPAAGLLTAVLAAVVFSLRGRPLAFGAGCAVFLATIAALASSSPAGVLHVERNFFGVKRVDVDASRRFHRFVHGTTTHGTQWIDSARRTEPCGYYDRHGPVGDVFAAIARRTTEGHVGVVGLGAGGLAGYASPSLEFTFYEIDPAVERIARDRRWFTYLDACGARCEVVLGDGRLELARAARGAYDLLVLDAFGSDAVPVHLLSREALDLYLDKLAPGGVLLFNVTNAYLDLAPVVARLAEDAGLHALERVDLAEDEQAALDGRMPTHFVVLARDPDALVPLAARPTWVRRGTAQDTPLWTDRYAALVGAFRAPRH